MKERIQELVEQATVATDQELRRLSQGIEGMPSRLDLFNQKFAELIVRECVNIGDNYQDILGNEPECFNCRKVAYGIVDKIKEHFGVE